MKTTPKKTLFLLALLLTIPLISNAKNYEPPREYEPAIQEEVSRIHREWDALLFSPSEYRERIMLIGEVENIHRQILGEEQAAIAMGLDTLIEQQSMLLIMRNFLIDAHEEARYTEELVEEIRERINELVPEIETNEEHGQHLAEAIELFIIRIQEINNTAIERLQTRLDIRQEICDILFFI